jgi:glyoxylase-like metal-dependent hydrolase (beta-lactamase superfamily II)
VDLPLSDGDEVVFGKVTLKVLHTPGHTPGSLCFLTDRYLLSGDTIFPGGPGRTNSPRDLEQVMESLTEKIFVLPDDTRIHPGHGESTVLKKEKDEFAAFSSRPHRSGLCGEILWLSS